MNLILLGAPSSGKGTISSFLVEQYHFYHISTGDIFRHEIQTKTHFGLQLQAIISQGKLVSDELTNQIIEHKLKTLTDISNIVLDGYPRTLVQAQFLSQIFHIDMVLFFKTDLDILEKRTIGRRVCNNCGRSYNIYYLKPKKEGICDVCNLTLIHRKDDYHDIFLNRMAIFNANNDKLLKFYSDTCKLITLTINNNDKQELYQLVKVTLGLN